MTRNLEKVDNLSQFSEFDGHKVLYKFKDSGVGLKGFLAIHNDNLGPATGGTRMLPYASEREAIADVLKLSRAMTYKCALAGVRHGGGKAVIIGDPEKIKTENFLRAYAKIIDGFNGEFSTGEDVGITEDDVQVMLQESRHFNGRRGLAGDPSPYAALTTFYAIQVAASEIFGTEDLFQKSAAIKGIGKVGGELMKLLIGAGAKIIGADIKPEVISVVKSKYPQVKIVDSDVIYEQPVEVFSPCALGNDLTVETVKKIRARIICGAANNQLATAEVGDELFRIGILYVPDYVANAGGLINVVDELDEGGYNKKRVLTRIENIKNTLRTIYLISRQKNQPTNRVADRLAEEIFVNGKSSNIVA